jgi:hypothetical protein
MLNMDNRPSYIPLSILKKHRADIVQHNSLRQEQRAQVPPSSELVSVLVSELVSVLASRQMCRMWVGLLSQNTRHI